MCLVVPGKELGAHAFEHDNDIDAEAAPEHRQNLLDLALYNGVQVAVAVLQAL